jgi:hypothetical protein
LLEEKAITPQVLGKDDTRFPGTRLVSAHRLVHALCVVVAEGWPDIAPPAIS